MTLADKLPLLQTSLLYPWGPSLSVYAYNRTGSTTTIGDTNQFDTGLTTTAETDPTDLVAVSSYDANLSSAFLNTRLPDGTAAASKLSCGFFGIVQVIAADNKPHKLVIIGEVTAIRILGADWASGTMVGTAGSPCQPISALRASDCKTIDANIGPTKIHAITKGTASFTDATTAQVLAAGAIVNGITGW